MLANLLNDLFPSFDDRLTLTESVLNEYVSNKEYGWFKGKYAISSDECERQLREKFRIISD